MINNCMRVMWETGPIILWVIFQDFSNPVQKFYLSIKVDLFASWEKFFFVDSQHCTENVDFLYLMMMMEFLDSLEYA